MPLAPILQHSASPARLTLQRTPARLSVEQRPAEMNVDSSGGGIEISHLPGQLSIDSSAARASMNYYSMLGLLGELVDYSGRQFERGISDMLAAGEQLQAVEAGAGAISALARERMFVDLNDRQFNIGLIPSTPPQVSYRAGTLSVRARGSAPRIQFRRSPPMISVEPPSTQVSVSRPQLRIGLDGVRLNILA
jgi:hypothetical protein